MPVNWKAADSIDRLFGAVLAAHELKIDYRKTAEYYGRGATYDSIEGRFRNFRKIAQELREELANGEEHSSSSNEKANGDDTGKSSTKGKKKATITGRVTKARASAKTAGKGYSAVLEKFAEAVADSEAEDG